MGELIHTYTRIVTDPAGLRYHVHAYGERNDLGTWYGWLVFHPEGMPGTALRTDRETTQPERDDLEYWASGLEPIYLEGALARARPM
jgi:hypothetical protein